jgi:two-component system LytT family response regulator
MIAMLTCVIIDDETHAVSEIEDLAIFSQVLNVVGTFKEPISAIAFLRQYGKVDIVFSDINMPEINGIDAAVVIRKYSNYLIFITAHRDYALDAFSVNADGYLLKPVSSVSFLGKIDDIVAKRKDQGTVEFDAALSALFIKGNTKNSFIKVDIVEIKLVSGLSNYSIIHTTKTSHITYMGLKDINEKLLQYKSFIRINKSAIVSFNFIKNIEGNMVFLTTGESFSVGSSYKSAFSDFIAKRTLNFN